MAKYQCASLGTPSAPTEGPDGPERPERPERTDCADPSEGAAWFFAEKYGVPRTYSDPAAMLAEEKPDIISVCTWPQLHAPTTIAAARSGVKAILCEKLLATTWGGAKEMARVGEENGVKLTFNHQRRFLGPFQAARARLAGSRCLPADRHGGYDRGTRGLHPMCA